MRGPVGRFRPANIVGDTKVPNPSRCWPGPQGPVWDLGMPTLRMAKQPGGREDSPRRGGPRMFLTRFAHHE